MAEGAGLLNRFTVKSRNGGSNPPLSAKYSNPLILFSGLFFFSPTLFLAGCVSIDCESLPVLQWIPQNKDAPVRGDARGRGPAGPA